MVIRVDMTAGLVDNLIAIDSNTNGSIANYFKNEEKNSIFKKLSSVIRDVALKRGNEKETNEIVQAYVDISLHAPSQKRGDIKHVFETFLGNQAHILDQASKYVENQNRAAELVEEIFQAKKEGIKGTENKASIAKNEKELDYIVKESKKFKKASGHESKFEKECPTLYKVLMSDNPKVVARIIDKISDKKSRKEERGSLNISGDMLVQFAPPELLREVGKIAFQCERREHSVNSVSDFFNWLGNVIINRILDKHVSNEEVEAMAKELQQFSGNAKDTGQTKGFADKFAKHASHAEKAQETKGTGDLGRK